MKKLFAAFCLICTCLSHAHGSNLTEDKLHPAERNKSAYSSQSKHKTSIVFKNSSDSTKKILWLNKIGERKLHKILRKGESCTQPTFLTHPWIVTCENDIALDIYYPDTSQRIVEIKSAKLSGKQNQKPLKAAILNLPLNSQLNGIVDSNGGSYNARNGTKWIAGPTGAGDALQFTPDSFVDLRNQGNFERDQQFSCSTWIKLDQNAIARNGALVARMNQWNDCRGWDVYVIAGQICFHLIHKWPDNAIKVVTQKKLNVDQWSHVTVTYDGNSKASGVRVYINGEAQKLQTMADSLSKTTRSNVPLTLGRRTANHSLSHGSIHDFKLYDYTLTPKQITSQLHDYHLVKNVKAPKGSVIDLTLREKQQEAIDEKGRSHRILKNPNWIAGPANKGQALQFTQESCVELGDLGSFERNEGFSGCAWVKLDHSALNRNGVLAARMNEWHYYRGWDLAMEFGNPCVHIVHKWPESGIKVIAKNRLKVDTWYHVAFTYDGSSRAQGIKIYVNGKPIELKTVVNNLDHTIQAKVPLTLGRRTPGTGLTNGAIRDFKLFDYTLSPKQVIAIASPSNLSKP